MKTVARMASLPVWTAAMLLVTTSGCRLANESPGSDSPRVVVREAPVVQFRGASSPAPETPGECDCNSPGHWSDGTLYVFNSAGHPWRSSGRNVLELTGDYRSCTYDNRVAGGRWIECTWKVPGGPLYGWYHLEPTGICPGSHPKSPQMSLTAPRIGAVRSRDDGATWQDLGVVLEAEPTLKCDTKNYYFAGGNGDFCIMLDSRKEYLYFFLSNYAPDVSQQGVALARMAWADRDSPAGKVRKFHAGSWDSPGLGGAVTPIFAVGKDWHQADVDAFWGPSVHWNTHLRSYVMLLNRAEDANWGQEGIYICYNRDLSNPLGWSTPEKILEAPGPDRWYPQVMGTNAARLESDKLAGRVSRLFVRGLSRWELVFP